MTLSGGGASESPAGILAGVVVVGRVPKCGAVLRSGAQAGDDLYVTGELGGSAAVLAELRRSGAKPKGRLAAAHFFPVPRVAAGRSCRIVPGSTSHQ